jgi:hypothetical protein
MPFLLRPLCVGSTVTIDYTITNSATAVAVDFQMPNTSTDPGLSASCSGLTKRNLANPSSTMLTCSYPVPAASPPPSLAVTAVATAVGLTTSITRTSTASLLNLQVVLTATLQQVSNASVAEYVYM